MTDDFSHLPYRRCAGVMLMNDAGRVWMGRRISKWRGDQSGNMWQMPQGGIDDGETPRDAALRELEEEIGTAKADFLAECGRWLTYDLPKEALGIALKGKYRGQRQKWFVMRFRGSDDDIDIGPKPSHKAEFDDWKWVALEDLPRLVVPFKRAVYEALVEEFTYLADGPASNQSTS